MKDRRAGLSLLIFILAVHIAFLLPQSSQFSAVTEGYSPTTCPGALNSARATLLLPSAKVGTKYISSLRSNFATSSSGTFQLSKGAIIVQGDPRNTLELQSKSGSWTSGITCNAGSTESWFVGGSAGVTSQSKLAIDNSGLSDATVEITTFSENGPSAAQSFTIAAASERIIRLDALNPGADKLVTKVSVMSGRVTAYLLDERVKGLKNLGGDFVPAVTSPSQNLVIAGIPGTLGKESTVTSILRVLAPGKIDGSLSVEVISPSGVFVPVDLGEVNFNSQEVIEIPLKNIQVGKDNFAIRIASTTPIVAGVYAEGKRKKNFSDFTWHSALSPFQNSTFNLYGLTPTITFVSPKISVAVEWRDNRGKVYRKNLKGDEILNWQVPANTRTVRLSTFTGTSASMTWTSADGLGTIAITNGSTLASATRPVAEISVIQPRHS